MDHQSLTTTHPRQPSDSLVETLGQQAVARNEATATNALAVATARLNDAINDHVVILARANGSTTPPATRFIHFSNSTARAIGLPKSDAVVIAALPIEHGRDR